MSRLHRLSQLTAALRHHVRYVWTEDAALAAGLDADLSRIEAEVSAMADAAMVQALTPARRTHCHCGAPITSRHLDAETCGHRGCIAQAREARYLVHRYARGE